MPKRNPFKLKPYQATIIKSYLKKLDGELVAVAEKTVQKESGPYTVVVENINVVKKEIYEDTFIYKVVTTLVYVGENRLNSFVKNEIDCYEEREARAVFNKILKR